MVTKKMKIQLQNGLEARPVAVLVQVASQYNSSIYVEYENIRHFACHCCAVMGMLKLIKVLLNAKCDRFIYYILQFVSYYYDIVENCIIFAPDLKIHIIIH